MSRETAPQFRRCFRGYDPAEVDACVDGLRARVAALEKEAAELKGALESYRTQEGLLRAALVSAEETAARVRERAEREAAQALAAAKEAADRIAAEADVRARALVADAAAYREEVRRRLYAYEREARILLDRFYAMARRHVEALEREFAAEVEALLARMDAEYEALPKPEGPVMSGGRREGKEPADALAAEWEEREAAALLGRVLARDVADSEGRTVARRGEVVTPELVERLAAAGLYGELVEAAGGGRAA